MINKDRTSRLGGPPIIPQVCESPGEPGLVSVLIPSYNRAYILGKAIDSVLAQTYRPIEVVVVDDGSSDGTQELVRSYADKVTYIYQQNAGLAAARNAGLAVARGEFIAFQDSDDLWATWKLEVQVALMRRFPEVALVWTDMTAVDPEGRVVRPAHLTTMYDVYRSIDVDDWLSTKGQVGELCANCPPEIARAGFRIGDIFDPMFMGNLVHPPVALMRRSHVRRAGGLDLAFAWTCEDYEFFWRVAREGLGALIDAPGMLYRVQASDQLTKPDLKLFIARGNLLAIEQRLAKDGDRLALPEGLVRGHLAEAHGWLAEEELLSPSGKRSNAIKSFWASLSRRPLQGRRLFLFLVSLTMTKTMLVGLQSAKQRLGAARGHAVGNPAGV